MVTRVAVVPYLVFCRVPCQIPLMVSTRHRISFFAPSQRDTIPVSPGGQRNKTAEPDRRPNPRLPCGHGRHPQASPPTLAQMQDTRTMADCSSFVGAPIPLHDSVHNVCCPLVKSHPHRNALFRYIVLKLLRVKA